MKMAIRILVCAMALSTLSYGFEIRVKDEKTKEVKTFEIGDEAFKIPVTAVNLSCSVDAAKNTKHTKGGKIRTLTCIDSESGTSFQIMPICVTGTPDAEWIGVSNSKVKEPYFLSIETNC
jgi:hypothetical protein